VSDHRGLPRAIRWLLGALISDDVAVYVLGDLEEEYHARVERTGRYRAWLWCWMEAVRSAWPLMTMPSGGRDGMMRGLGQDLRSGLRVFVRQPGFAAVVVVTLALGIGGASAVYSVIRGVVLSPLEFPNADRVVALWGQTPDYPRAPLTVGDHNELLHNVDAFQAVAAGWGNSTLLLGGTQAEAVSFGWVTPEYFRTLGLVPEIGRMPEAGEEAAVVLSHGLWVRRYGADPEVIGRVIDVGGNSFEVVGVIPEHSNPNLAAFSGNRTNYDLWRLQPAGWTQGEDRSVGWLRSAALLKPGVTLSQAQQEVDAHFERVNANVTNRDGGTDLRINLIPVREDLVSGISRTLWVLLGAVLGVLLVAAGNVAHLMLARGEERDVEVAVRAALGGSRTRLVRQFLVESSVLAAVGGVVGIGVASLGVQTLLRWAPPNLPRLDTVGMDPGVILFALGATGATVLVFGVVPALRSTRSDLASAMAQRSGTMGPREQRLSRGLVVLQVALSLTLVSGTGLLLRSLSSLHGADLGFQTENILTFDLQAPNWTQEGARARLTDFKRRLEGVPGVQAVGFTNRIPLGGGLYTASFASEEMVDGSGPATVPFRNITPGFLEAMGARLVAGRAFTMDDPASVFLVDEIAAEIAWPGENPVGRRIQVTQIGSDPEWGEVIGVVASMKHAGLAEPAEATIFTPMMASAWNQNFRYAAVRASTDPLLLLDALGDAVREVDANAVVARPKTMEAFFSEQVAAPRFATLLLMLFGLTALLLATVGLHGVMAYRIQRRRREMGIRMALGAEPGGILRDAFFSGAGLVVGGIALGVALTLLGLDPILEALLVEVGSGDPVTLVGSAVVILITGLVGAYLPARLALGVDPATSLREG